MESVTVVSDSQIPGLNLIHRGKVRDVYEIDDDRLLLVATDRLSAFDCVLPTLIPYKGEVLTQLSAFWFSRLSGIVGNHLISTDTSSMPEPIPEIPSLRGRSTLAKRTQVFPVECIVRGYLEGSGWKDYLKTGSICGHELASGLRQCDRLPEPIFTPATKAASGHDENIDFERFASIIGHDTADFLRTTSLKLYREAADYALDRGIIIADTKFEFGCDANGNIRLIDEVLTPDSSRFWNINGYEPGHAQPSFDKQFVREYLETLDWDKTPPAPELPQEIAAATAERYLEAFRLLTGQELETSTG
ncbi:phosphoribosylaminoimidazolesuccinocarboxamide synthase [soil metagenome]